MIFPCGILGNTAEKVNARKRLVSMRWKLLVLVSFVAALLALGLWSALAIALFGSARVLAQSDWRWLSSLIIPLGVTAYAGMFVYRHTAKRRKLQALIVTILVLLLTGASYLIASRIVVSRFSHPQTQEVQETR
jgi:cation transport ATPase